MDSRTRRNLGALCIAAVLLLIGAVASANAADGLSQGVGTVALIAGVWVALFALVSLGVDLIRSRD